jgi:dolichol-phosphate mannosyltransferase
LTNLSIRAMVIYSLKALSGHYFVIKSNQALSIVIPTLNEVGSAAQLVRRIDGAMHIACREYQIIVIDDHSTDGTVNAYQALRHDYPIRLITKAGEKGKAQSLIEGFSYSKYPLIAMIDADLQYPPEALVEMLTILDATSADVVLTNRVVYEASLLRRFISYGYRLVFVRFLFGFNYDTQSGLKLFRKGLLKNLELTSSRWSFDLDFIVRARLAGAVIVQQPIIFAAREFDEAKINVLQASIEVARASLKLRLDLYKERRRGTKEYTS